MSERAGVRPEDDDDVVAFTPADVRALEYTCTWVLRYADQAHP